MCSSYFARGDVATNDGETGHGDTHHQGIAVLSAGLDHCCSGKGAGACSKSAKSESGGRARGLDSGRVDVRAYGIHGRLQKLCTPNPAIRMPVCSAMLTLVR